MKTEIIILLISVSIIQIGFSQNLVPNGDFENYSSLPTDLGQIYLCDNWFNPGMAYVSPSPDFYHSLGIGYVALPNSFIATVSPFSGDAVVGFVVAAESNQGEDAREYISTELLLPLNIGSNYKVSFWLTNGFSNHITGASCNHVGIRFSLSPLNQTNFNPLGGIPQVEIQGEVWNTSWEYYSFYFTADSTYNYLTVGNFYDNISTSFTQQVNSLGDFAYYFIDQVELIEIQDFQIIGGSSLCQGDSITLTTINETSFAWADSLNPNVIISTDSTITISPNSTTTYFVYGTNDTISFTVVVEDTPIVDLGDDVVLCEGEALDLDATNPNAIYLWQNNSMNPSYSVTGEGIYWVEVTEENCSTADSITITSPLLDWIRE